MRPRGTIVARLREMLMIFYEPQLVLGLGIDAVLLAVVATGAWVP